MIKETVNSLHPCRAASFLLQGKNVQQGFVSRQNPVSAQHVTTVERISSRRREKGRYKRNAAKQTKCAGEQPHCWFLHSANCFADALLPRLPNRTTLLLTYNPRINIPSPVHCPPRQFERRKKVCRYFRVPARCSGCLVRPHVRSKRGCNFFRSPLCTVYICARASFSA